jgi:hypothetical protein
MSNTDEELGVLTREQATQVARPEFPAPWEWPDPVLVMVGNTNQFGMTGRSHNGDPYMFAVALSMLESLYDAGYVVAKVNSRG